MPHDKTHFSFLIAFSRQLAKALEGDGDDDVALALSSLAVSLEVLIADGSDHAGDDDGGVHEGVDTDDTPGDDTPLGAALARVAELERSAARAVDLTQRRSVGGTTPPARVLVVGGRRRKPAVLKGARRGKK